LVGYTAGARYLRRGDALERVMTVRADADFFTMLGVPAMRGRTFDASDRPDVAVVSASFWERRLAGDPAAIGATLILDDEPVTVIGVMPASFQFPYGAASLLPGVAAEARTDVWLPLPADTRPVTRLADVTARLKPGVTMAAAEAELKAIARRLETALPDAHGGRTVYLEPLADAVLAPPVRRALFLLAAAVGLLLALACANVANLTIARLALRRREMAVRAALGAGRVRLARQFLTESLLLSLAGGLLGAALAWWGTASLLQLAAPHVPRLLEVAIDWRVFAFLLAACAVVAALVGLAPAALAARGNPRAALQETGGHATAGVTERRLRDGLVIAEVALACLLAIGAAMLVRELVRLRETDAGMTTDRVATIHLGHRATPDSDPRQFYAIADRVAALPGVEAAGFTQLLPLQNWGWYANSGDFAVRGRAPVRPVFQIQLRYVTPGYFDALGIRIERGRGFTAADTRGAPGVIVINRALAARIFGDDDPIGRETSRGTIVGVVADVRQVHLDQPAEPELYYPAAQNWSQLSELGMTLVVRTQTRPEPIIEPVRSVVRAVAPHLSVFNVKTMEQVVAESLSEFTLYLSLLAGFAVLAVVLAMTGTYGVIACLASARAREFAIRVALGADRGEVLRLVLRQTALLAALGLAAGVAAALVASPLVAGLPVTVRPPGAATIAPVVLFIATIALAASLAPARRAARVDPTTALRTE
jgi:predicted permease